MVKMTVDYVVLFAEANNPPTMATWVKEGKNGWIESPGEDSADCWWFGCDDSMLIVSAERFISVQKDGRNLEELTEEINKKKK